MNERREPVPEQRAAIDDRDRDLFLFAGAGSGKTTVLVERFCDAVCAVAGADADSEVGSILAFTFTDRAAGEMKRRIRAELRRRAAAEPDPARASFLRGQAREAESAWISTIHAFCQRLLAAHPLAAGLDPRFTVLDEAGAGRLALEAFETAFEALHAGDPDGAVELAAAFRLEPLREIAVAAHDELRSRGERPELPAVAEPDVAGALAELHHAAREALAATQEATGQYAERNRERMGCALALGEDAGEDEVAACCFKSDAAAFEGAEVERYHGACRALERRLVERASGHQYERLRTLVRLFAAEYAARKDGRSALDFEDLQLRARDLLRSRPDLRRRLQERFRHLMVDEFQDTNLLQLALIELLHLEGGVAQNRLFTVGDEFQSIYSFRHADVDVFRQALQAAADAPEADAGVGELLGNFRARPEVLALVNAVGRALLPGFRELTVGALPDRPPRGEGPPVELLVTEQEGWDEDGALGDVSPDEQAQGWRVAEARCLARRLRELCDAGFPRGDMVVLLRAFTYVEAYEDALVEQELAPYVVGGRGYWSRQQVTDLRHLLGVIANPLDELALFSALASPCCGASPDALWLLRQAAAERRPWTALRALFGPHEPPPPPDDPERAEREAAWRAAGVEWIAHMPPEDVEALREFTATLLAMREEAPRLSLEELIDRAGRDFGYDLALLMRRGGRRRMANVRKLMRLAREFEAGEGRDLRAFLEFVDSEREIRAREGEAALQAEKHDGVRIMTVHGAKGLEFPLVAVADLGRGLGGGFPPALRLRPGGAETEGEPAALRVGLRLARLGRKGKQIFDYEELQALADQLTSEEERRVLHVAITRAEERLILSGACKRARLDREPRPLAPLTERLLPALGTDGSDGALTLGAPLARDGLDASFEPVELAVRLNAPGAEPGQQALRLVPGPEPIDESALAEALPDPQLAPLAGVAQAPAVTHVSYSALSLYGRCGYRFYAERVLGMRPATEGLPGDAELDALERRYARGRVVHELLERSARLGWERPPAELAADLLRREGVPDGGSEVERALALVDGFLSSPLRAELAAAERALPEVPFAFRLGALVVRGEIDLLADLPGEVLVVDYKSDRLEGSEPAAQMERYDVQRRIYALAALRRYGRPVRVAYVFLERPGEPVEERFEPDEVEALAAGLEALTRGIEEGRFEVTAAPHRALCFDCPARRRLCSHPPELTLAAEPPVAGGTLAG